MTDMSKVLWWVIVEPWHEQAWRESLGQSDIDDWCAAHGWCSRDVRSGSVMVSAFKDGHVEVMAELFERGPDGERFMRGDDIASRLAWSDYRRPLPEGIAPVSRP
jgi:hypothetical protein